jgi:hypothetical protein
MQNFKNTHKPGAGGAHLATQEAEIRSQPVQTVHDTLSQKSPSQKRASEVAQGIVPEFNLQYLKKKNKNNTQNSL